MSRWMVWGAALVIESGPLLFTGCQSASLRAGKLYLKQQNYDAAVTQLEHAVQDDSTSAEALYQLGRAYGLAGYCADMVVAFERSLDLSSEYAKEIAEERRHYWTRIYNDGVRVSSLRDPDLDRARSKFALATRILPERLQGWRNLGFTQYSLHDVDGAIVTFEHITRVTAGDTASLRTLGTLYLEQGRFEDAVTAFEEVLGQGEQMGALTNLAIAYLGQSDTVAAEAAYLRAVAVAPEHWQCYYNIGNLYWQQERFEEARGAFERAVELNGEDVDARYNLAVTYLKLGQLDEAYPLLERLKLEMPDNFILWRELGRVYAHLGMTAASAAAYARAQSLSD